MIAGLSKAITLYLSPLLCLTAILLSLFAFLAPTVMLHDQVALLTVTPSLVLVQAGPLQDIDGPSVFLGALGSCARVDNAAGINCTSPTISPVYDLSVLSSNAPRLLLSAPTPTTPAFLAVAISFSILFLISFTLVTFRHKLGKLQTTLDKPLVQRMSAWVGFFGFLIGITSFLIIRMWFGKAVQDFNNSIIAQGQEGAQIVANIGNAFTMIWVAYAFYAIPLIISLSKLNVVATK
jgi:hypothetical protein